MTITSNREAATSFLGMIIAGKIREAFRAFASDDVRHHNPFFSGDPESLIAGMEHNEAEFPHKIFEVKHAIADGDLVAVHSHLRFKPEDPGIITVHMFRFERGRIVEMWDVGQQIPPDSPNQNGAF